MKIAVVGLGYVGIANAILLAQYNEVVGMDVSKEKVDLLNRRVCPIDDEYASEFLSNENLALTATTDLSAAVCNADFVIVCAPTNYDEELMTRVIFSIPVAYRQRLDPWMNHGPDFIKKETKFARMTETLLLKYL